MNRACYIHPRHGVVIILVTCLLLVGGAYRLKDREADRLRRENTRLRDGLKYEAGEHLRLERDAAIQRDAEAQLARWKARYADEAKVFQEVLDRLSIYTRTYPEPPELKEKRESAPTAPGLSYPGKSDRGCL